MASPGRRRRRHRAQCQLGVRNGSGRGPRRGAVVKLIDYWRRFRHFPGVLDAATGHLLPLSRRTPTHPEIAIAYIYPWVLGIFLINFTQFGG